MKSHTFLLLLLIVIIFFPEFKRPDSVDKFLLHASEGMVAVQYCITNFSDGPTPIPEPVKPVTPDKVYKCKTCKDTGKVKSGDGIFEFPCPECQVPKTPTGCQCGCGKLECKCGLTKSATCSKPTEEGKKEEAVIIRRVLLFTQPTQCQPCAIWNNGVRPKIIGGGFTVSNKVDSNIREVNPTGTAEEINLWSKYSHLSGGGIPLFVALEGDKIISSRVGAISELETLKLLGK